MSNIDTPKFSVLIANYNNGKYLEDCLQSVFSQSYTTWEIILVDDGSNDDISYSLYKKYETNPKIRIFYNYENRGCGYTKRRCLEEATGQICAFLDPDDAIRKDALEVMIKEHMAHPNHSIIYSTHYVCDQNLSIIKISGGPSVLSGEDYFTSKNGDISAFASFKLAKYKQTEGISSFYKRAIDHDLYFKLEETGPTKFVSKALYYYRNHSGGISLNDNWWKARYWDIIIMLDTQKRRQLKNYMPNRKKEEILIDFDNYYLNVMKFFLNKNNFAKTFKFFIISLKYSSLKTLIRKTMLLAMIPLKFFMIIKRKVVA